MTSHLRRRYFFGDTWVFDGQTWEQKSPAHAPGYGDGVPTPAIVYDAASARVLLWQYMTGLWTWNGADWSRLTAANPPPVTIDGRLGFDAKSAQVILWGRDMSKNGYTPENWLFNGRSWSLPPNAQYSGPDSPEAHIVYDAKREKLLLFAALISLNKGDSRPVSIWEWGEAGWEAVWIP